MANDFKSAPFNWQDQPWTQEYEKYRKEYELDKKKGVYYPATSTTALSQQIDSAINQLGNAIARQERLLESVFQMMEALMKDMENYRKEITAYTNKMVRSCPQCDMIKEGVEFEEGDYICRPCREVRND